MGPHKIIEKLGPHIIVNAGMGLFACFAQPKSKYDVQTREEQKSAPTRLKEENLEKGTSGPTAPCPGQTCQSDEPCFEDAVNPDASLIANMLDPDGPASVERGKAYQVHYLGPPRPYCDEERVETLQQLGKIDYKNAKPQDPEIANILKLVSQIFQAPAVLCALFDEKQVYVSEQHGEVVPHGHFPWRWTLCGWSLAFKSPQVLVIPDTFKDARFVHNKKCVDNPKVRFYCGAPLLASNGHRLGTLCFADVKPRVFDRSSCVMMNSFSELVVRQLEKDMLLKAKAQENRLLSNATNHLQRTIDCLDSCVMLLDTSKPGLEIAFTNAAFAKVTDVAREDVQGKTLTDLMVCMDGTQLPSSKDLRSISKLQDFTVQEARIQLSPEAKSFKLCFRPAARQIMDDNTVPFGVPAHLPLDGGDGHTQRFYFMTIERHSRHSITKSDSTLGSSVLSTLSSCQSSSSLSSGDVVEGLKLAHLLGRGSFGVVYAGQWYGTDVAVKIIDHDLFSLLGSDGAVKEANMAFKLRHPHIVATLKYMVKNVGNARSVPTFSSCARSPNYLSALKAGADLPSGFLPRNLDSRMSDKPASPVDPRWAVIQAETPIPEKVEEVQEKRFSEVSLAMHELCKVKEDGWKDLEDEASPVTSSTNCSKIVGFHETKIPVHDSGKLKLEQPKQTWIILEYCDRGSLQDALDRGWLRKDVTMMNSPPNMDDVIATALEIVSALQFMHSQGIVHGDLSAWNVMLTSLAKGTDSRGWVAKIADFGMSRALDAVAISTKTYGTITHMPPETLTQGLVSTSMDVYSLGVLMWQLYTGSRPFSGCRQAVVIDNMVNKRVRLQWPQRTPSAYQAIADACMAYECEARPTCAEVVEKLEAYLPTSTEWQAPTELYF